MSKPSRAKLYGIIAIVAVVVVVAVLVPVLVTQTGKNNNNNAAAPAARASTNKAVTPNLPRCEKNQLLHLEWKTSVRKRANGDAVVAARCIHGKAWEEMPDLDFAPPKLECNGLDCRVPHKGRDFNVRNLTNTIPPRVRSVPSRARAARLLLQGTLGPTLAEIDSGDANDAKTWIKNQMAMSASLMRPYYRARANPGANLTRATGGVQELCESGSRWNAYALSWYDEGLVFQARAQNKNEVQIRVAGQFRGRMPKADFPDTIALDTDYTLCQVNQRIGGLCSLERVGGECNSATLSKSLRFPNPSINLGSNPPESRVQRLADGDATFKDVQGRGGEAVILQSINVPCNATISKGPRYFMYKGRLLAHDPRTFMVKNHVGKPAKLGEYTGTRCSSAPATFLNEHACVRGPTCDEPQYGAADVPLDDAGIRTWYTDQPNRRYVYYVTGLLLKAPFDVSPCSGTSRWLRTKQSGCGHTAPDTTSRSTFQKAIRAARGTVGSTAIVDITWGGGSCTASTASIGCRVTVDNECWQHVHPDEYSVRDFTKWISNHPGGPNAIKKWAVDGGVELRFPNDERNDVPVKHEMQRWADHAPANAPLVGVYNGTVSFLDLATELQTDNKAHLVGASRQGSDAGVMCGSHGENSNNPLLGNRYSSVYGGARSAGFRQRQLDFPSRERDHAQMVWLNRVIKAPDQLRQRVAWALAQIVTMGMDGSGSDARPEKWLSYYDIFVRNAFGSYFDILKEVSYNPRMGTYLSFKDNRAYASSGAFPDENYAREIMQLFSVGLVKLRDDGTTVLDENGEPVPAYDIDDIVDMARAWTGFDWNRKRGNYETHASNAGNDIDPMQIKPGNRDRMPKANLGRGYLGDTYPLCNDLPAQHFLSEGATFTYTGTTSVEGLELDAMDPSQRLHPTPNKSALWKRLCKVDSAGKCTFPSKVVLPKTIKCHGSECGAGRVYSVAIHDPTTDERRYYAYKSVPCTKLALFGGGQRAMYSSSKSLCMNPASSSAAPACCRPDNLKKVADTNAAQCQFINEAVNFTTAKARCEAVGAELCGDTYVRTARFGETCTRNVYQWLDNSPCALKVQVYPSGQVSVVDDVASEKLLSMSSGNVFRVFWNKDEWPKAVAGSCPSECVKETTPQGDSCVCTFVARDKAHYRDDASFGTKASQIAGKLFIGAPKPSCFGTGVYVRHVKNGFPVWQRSGEAMWSTKTIVELPPFRKGGRVRYLFNRYASVKIGSYVFRTPPTFMPFTGEIAPTNQDFSSTNLLKGEAAWETEALLEHLFEHANTAPFVCYRLIQRLVTSNPSPRYMKAVVRAFRNGNYGSDTFSDKYGDLGAAVNAILRDREARMPLVEADAVHGGVREPLLKVVQLLRSLEYKTDKGREWALHDTFQRIGQDAFRASSVFGFYLPEYRPEGPVTNTGLVSPESELLTSPMVIENLNGLASLIDHGLTSCDDGFGYTKHEDGRNCKNPQTNTHATHHYAPDEALNANQVIDELDTLLTGRRMSDATRAAVKRAWEDALSATGGSREDALKRALIVATASAEFNTRGTSLTTSKKRASAGEVAGNGRKFKAIVVVFEPGAADSFNLLVPYSGCKAKDGAAHDLYQEYETVRGGAAIGKSALSKTVINANNTAQPCSQFALFPKMKNLHKLYTNAEALMLANIGGLVELATKAEYLDRKNNNIEFPPSLFAHNMMQRALQNVHAQDGSSKGVLGRMVNELVTNVTTPFRTGLFSLLGQIKMLEGSLTPTMLDSKSGLVRYARHSVMQSYFGDMANYTSDSVYAETFNSVLQNALASSQSMGAQLDSTSATTTWNSASDLESQLETVSRVIRMAKDTSQLSLERAVFVVRKTGWDTHNTFELDDLFGDVDNALGKFATEMKSQGVWDDVVVVSVSDFGRTLTSNGKGTDHAWGGNHFVAGGKIKGGTVLGKFPFGLTDAGDDVIGRGRVLPTTPWEGMWDGIARWFGVPSSSLDAVLPNKHRFGSAALFNKKELFR